MSFCPTVRCQVDQGRRAASQIALMPQVVSLSDREPAHSPSIQPVLQHLTSWHEARANKLPSARAVSIEKLRLLNDFGNYSLENRDSQRFVIPFSASLLPIRRPIDTASALARHTFKVDGIATRNTEPRLSLWSEVSKCYERGWLVLCNGGETAVRCRADRPDDQNNHPQASIGVQCGILVLTRERSIQHHHVSNKRCSRPCRLVTVLLRVLFAARH